MLTFSSPLRASRKQCTRSITSISQLVANWLVAVSEDNNNNNNNN